MIHCSYQVLVEETVSAEERERRRNRTDKENRLNLKTTAALELTNEMFQDAVCCYTLMLAGMVKDARWTEETVGYAKWMETKLGAKAWQAKRKQMLENSEAINPLWQHIATSPEMRGATANVVKRLAKNYPSAIFRDSMNVGELVEKAFGYQGDEQAPDGTRREKPSRVTPLSDVLVKTFVQHLMLEALKIGSSGDSLADMASVAGVWSVHLCNPSGRSRPKGTGVYERLHMELRAAVEESKTGSEWLRTKTELATLGEGKEFVKQRKEIRAKIVQTRDAILTDKNNVSVVCNRVKQLADERARENETANTTERAALLERALKSPDRKEKDTDETIRKKVNEEWKHKAVKARETALGGVSAGVQSTQKHYCPDISS